MLATTPPKCLLWKVSGRATTGEVLAIMGPSGAGKTTLINLLCGIKGSSEERRFGTVTLDGHPFTGVHAGTSCLTARPERCTHSPRHTAANHLTHCCSPCASAGAMYKSYCAVVTQSDRNWTYLTPREHLHLACGFHQAVLPADGLDAVAEELLERTGLTSCAGVGLRSHHPSPPRSRRSFACVSLLRSPSVYVCAEPPLALFALFRSHQTSGPDRTFRRRAYPTPACPAGSVAASRSRSRSRRSQRC